MNIAADLQNRSLRWSERPALYEGGTSWSHGRLHDTAARAASVLAGRGVRPGTRVLLALPDGIAWVTAFLAVARLGAVAVLANPALPERDHGFIAQDAEVVLALCEDGIADRFAGTGSLSGDRMLAEAAGAVPAPAADVFRDTPLYVQYTSGTTGSPKGVVHRHADLWHYHAAFGAARLRLGPQDVTFSVSRLFFAYGFGNSLVLPLYSGGSAVLTAERPGPALVAETVERHRVSVLYAVPSGYAALAAGTDPSAFTGLRAAVSAGERLVPAHGERYSQFLGTPLLDQLGSTEAGHAMCANGVDDNTPGTIGRPVPGFEFKILAKSGEEIGGAGEGELWVRGPSVTTGYLNRPEETADTLADGWLATRDRVRRNPDGTYTHLGRTDDLEMVGGITVSPLEVEQVLGEHPGVGDVAVACVLDEAGASRLHAFVVPTARASDRLAEELTHLARGRLAAFKVPRSVRTVPALPRTQTGKLQRFLLRQGAW